MLDFYPLTRHHWLRNRPLAIELDNEFERFRRKAEEVEAANNAYLPVLMEKYAKAIRKRCAYCGRPKSGCQDATCDGCGAPK